MPERPAEVTQVIDDARFSRFQVRIVALCAGMGWAYEVGRVASILGPSLAGLFLTLGFGARTIISLMAIPAALATVGAFWPGLRNTNRTSAPSIAPTATAA